MTLPVLNGAATPFRTGICFSRRIPKAVVPAEAMQAEVPACWISIYRDRTGPAGAALPLRLSLCGGGGAGTKEAFPYTRVCLRAAHPCGRMGRRTKPFHQMRQAAAGRSERYSVLRMSAHLRHGAGLWQRCVRPPLQHDLPFWISPARRTQWLPKRKNFLFVRLFFGKPIVMPSKKRYNTIENEHL